MRRLIFLGICAVVALGMQLTGCSEKFQAPVAPEPVIIHDSIHDTIVRDSLIYLPGETIYDTTFITRDSFIVDTIVIDSTVYDTVIVEVPNLVWKDCAYWKVSSDKLVAMIQLHNPAGTFMVGMERIRLSDQIPDDLELIFDFGNGQVFQKSIYGAKHFVDWSSPVTLPKNAMVTISVRSGWFAGKITDETCVDYFKGYYIWGLKPPDSN